MYIALIILILLVCFLLALVVLAQNPKGGGLSSQFGAGGAASLMGVKRTGDLLEKLTWGFAIGLVVLSLGTHMLTGTTSWPRAQRQPAARPGNQAARPGPCPGRPGARLPGPRRCYCPGYGYADHASQPATALRQSVIAGFSATAQKPVVPREATGFFALSERAGLANCELRYANSATR